MIHKIQEELISEVNEAKKKIKVGGKYFHYKHSDQLYTVLRIGLIEKAERICVIYEAEYGGKLVWVRPLEDFLAKVRLEDGTEVDRFTKVE
jgi:hypothetical protein